MRRVLITGASSGIGAATALHLDARGFEVFAGARAGGGGGAGPAGGEGRAALAGASERLRRVALDVTDPASVEAAVATVEEGLGGAGLDGLVNNAGIAVPGPLELLDVAEIREQLEVNVLGQVAMTQAALPLLRGASGRVVFVGSLGGRVTAPFAGPYHASKFAMEAISDVWRQELEPEELAVILIEPSAISTPIWDKAIGRVDALLSSADPRAALPRPAVRVPREPPLRGRARQVAGGRRRGDRTGADRRAPGHPLRRRRRRQARRRNPPVRPRPGRRQARRAGRPPATLGSRAGVRHRLRPRPGEPRHATLPSRRRLTRSAP